MPVLMINNYKDKTPVSIIDYVAMLAWFVGFTIECAADV